MNAATPVAPATGDETTAGAVSPAGAAPVTPASPPAPGEQRNGKIAWMIIGAAMVIGAGLGVLVYLRAADGSVVIAHDFREIRTRGANLDADGCVEASIEWFSTSCAAVGKMCIDAVPRMVGECLAAKDRAADCTKIGNDMKPSQWAYARCKALGIDKGSKKPVKESCTLAWRAYDSWCKSGQKGVAL